MHDEDAGARRQGRREIAVAPSASVTGLEALRAGDIHVWYVDLAMTAGTVGRLAACLSEDERGRAFRFKFGRDARRFMVARSTLRVLLGGYLGLAPHGVAFTYGAHGKPALDGIHAALSFNLSHSGDVAVVAAGWNRAVGVDVELRRTLPDLAALAARSFAPRERAVLDALPEMERPAAFFRCWTRKEAFIKATGRGWRNRSTPSWSRSAQTSRLASSTSTATRAPSPAGRCTTCSRRSAMPAPSSWNARFAPCTRARGPPRRRARNRRPVPRPPQGHRHEGLAPPPVFVRSAGYV